MNYKIVLAYDGTDFHGWQRQPRRRTIQGVLEDALAKIQGSPVTVIAAGRTDAGVHALAQVAGFKADLRLRTAELLKALNAILPRDVRVISAAQAGPDFHPRRSARSKIYRYRIYLGKNLSPFLLRYILHWPHPLDIGRMRTAARLFVRRADFTPFSANRERQPIRRVTRSELRKKGLELEYTVEADGFLRYMVRAMVGTLLEVGRGRIPPEAIEQLFQGKKRTLASPTAPARGLALVKVKY